MRLVANKFIYFGLTLLMIVFSIFIAQLLYMPRFGTSIIEIPREEHIDYSVIFPSSAKIILLMSAQEKAFEGEVLVFRGMNDEPILRERIRDQSHSLYIYVDEPGIYFIRIRNYIDEDVIIYLSIRFVSYNFKNRFLLFSLFLMGISLMVIGLFRE